MSFYERAWKERVTSEDKAALEHAVAMKAVYRNKMGPTPTGAQPAAEAGERPTVLTAANLESLSSNKGRVASNIGSSVRVQPPASVAASVARSSHSTQPSHRGASSVAVSGLTEFNSRLQKLEQKLTEEREERQQVFHELQQIKELMLAQNAKQKK